MKSVKQLKKEHYIDQELVNTYEQKRFSDIHGRALKEVEWHFVRKILRDSDKILDAGTGPGIFARKLALQGKKITAVDFSPTMLKKAKRLSGKLDITYIESDIEHMPFESGGYEKGFDAVVSFRVLQHLPVYKEIIQEYLRVTKNKGYVIFNIPNSMKDHPFDYRSKEEGDLSYAHKTTANEMESIAKEFGASCKIIPYTFLTHKKSPFSFFLNELTFTVYKAKEIIFSKIWPKKYSPLFLVILKKGGD